MVTEARAADPAFAGRFKLEIGTRTIGTFMEVSGLSVQVNVEELVEGGQNGYVHRLPGRMTWPNLVLKRGITQTDALFEWLWQVSGDGYAAGGNAFQRENGSVHLCGPTGTSIRTWTFSEAFPVKWSGPKLAASATELAVEELELCHRGFSSVARG